MNRVVEEISRWIIPAGATIFERKHGLRSTGIGIFPQEINFVSVQNEFEVATKERAV
jgi:hypothetical protein